MYTPIRNSKELKGVPSPTSNIPIASIDFIKRDFSKKIKKQKRGVDMTQGIKFIETYEHDDYCSQLYDAVSEYESQGYTVEIKPQIEIEADHDEFSGNVKEAKHLYTALVIASDTALEIASGKRTRE